MRVVATHRRGIVPRRIRYACADHVDTALSLFPSTVWDIALIPVPAQPVCDKCGRPLFLVDGRWVDSESDTAILGSNQICTRGGRGGLLHTVDGSPTHG
ncbi:hypothetical protein [Nocardioides panzhihuensis]|uniref:Uncharacterized protein n=1 Tax=Nocardioides panzhihuensis TaxID=860243 RepID=A0A7Z0IRB7_9ACTN|nr:hypothetical protein [Nocardioides panzhihuensis]NYI76640.1 hypothetical protein [Nocardioides panzhihuensis]